MFRLIVLCLLPLTSLANVAWEDCGAADRSIVFRKVGLASPLTISSSQPLLMDLAFDLLDPLDTDVNIDIEMRRYFSILGIKTSIKIPCINDVGSCSGPFCYFVQSYANLARSVANQLNVPFSCELEPTHVNGTVTYSVPTSALRRIPSVLLSAASGDYGLIVRWKSIDREIACLSIRSNINIVN
ncbi:uncharacterized protein LOC107367170 [Tetranychus urticae]|uniref:MD-2-related lipid-recognition domain-containing protein n=1 Tax=Tetranychus urticae TaxID=32264 RepID=T1KU96_TETUR|nr:uncharacterized protein LOC107367170 [Tetranychus urticae]